MPVPSGAEYSYVCVLGGLLLIMVAKDWNDYGFLHCHVKCGVTEEIIVLICFAAYKISSHSDKQFRNVML